MKRRLIVSILVVCMIVSQVAIVSANEIQLTPNEVVSNQDISIESIELDEDKPNYNKEGVVENNNSVASASYGEILVTAGGLAVADGPLPIGDALATGLLVYSGGKLVVDYAPSFWDWVVAKVKSIFLSETDLEEGDEIEVKFPSGTNDMDELLGVEGEHIPDTPSTPGRRKTEWDLGNGDTIVREKHPYDTGAPRQHRSWHWHVNVDGEHDTYNQGDTIPDEVWEVLAD